MSDDELAQFEIEVDVDNAGNAWFVVWHRNCGQLLIEDYADRKAADFRELIGKAKLHLLECSK
jgi:hypothetical protein